jgi:hypothetical protein
MYVIYKPKIQEIRIAYGAQNDPKPNLGDGSAEIPMSNTTDQFSSKKKELISMRKLDRHLVGFCVHVLRFFLCRLRKPGRD